MGGDKNYRRPDLRPCQLRLKIKPAGAWQAHIQDQTVGASDLLAFQKLSGGAESNAVYANGFQQKLQAVANIRIIIDNAHESFGVRAIQHCRALIGSVERIASLHRKPMLRINSQRTCENAV
jgi:hypothetical protein